MKQSKLYIIWILFLSVILAFGLFGIVRLFIIGHGEMFETSDFVPWTLLIAVYIFFVLTSTGATFIAAIPTVFNIKEFKPLVKRSIFIGIAALIAGFIAMGLELGNPMNMFYYFISPNFSSPIWWMGLFYMMLLVVLVYKFYLIQTEKENEKNTKTLSIIAFVVEIAALSTLGLVFGLIDARPTFFGEYVQVYFLFTAILSGIAAILFFTIMYYWTFKIEIPENIKVALNKLTKIFVFTIGVTILFSIWRIIIGLYSNRPEFNVIQFIIRSFPYRFEILVGLALPFTILLIQKLRESIRGQFFAAIFVFTGLGIGRMNMIMIGQIQPIIPKYTNEVALVNYFPSFWEWLMGFFALAVMLFFMTIGEKYLKLDKS